MRRLGIRLAQAGGLLLLACAHPEPGPARSDTHLRPRSGAARWIERPPDGCAVGSSGPTLNPRDAIRNARLSAIEALAADRLAIDVQSVAGIGPDGSGFEISAQALSGTLADARVVALRADTDPGRGARGRVREIFALACWPDASLRDVPAPAHPRWLLEPPRDGGRICAVGISGPTRRPEDQPSGALRDGRLALAMALESWIEKRIFDDGRGIARIAREVEPSAAALARAAGARELAEAWLDEQGTGPLGMPGVLYGLACIDA